MITSLKFNNCFSFNNTIEMSFKADMRTKKFSSNITSITDNLNILKSSVIYGPNNTGKTTLINCIKAIKGTLLNKEIHLNSNIFTNNNVCEEAISFIYDKKEYYLFPTVKELENVTKEEYRECGVGFRDAYLYNTVKEILNGSIDLENIDNMTTQNLRNKLLTLKGVGPKVADCILLFSCKRGEVFPIDVWVERVMSVLYFKEQKSTKKQILEYANNKFSKYAGIVQQHLFYNMRENLL